MISVFIIILVSAVCFILGMGSLVAGVNAYVMSVFRLRAIDLQQRTQVLSALSHLLWANLPEDFRETIC